MSDYDFDIVIVGGGHAGTEAAVVINRLGMKAALVTMDKNKLALMSCNPAVGGVGKGHLVREVDSLGGLIGKAADFAGIQFRRLNLSKGPAVRSTRVQCDRREYTKFVSNHIALLPNITIIEDEATGLITDGQVISGVILRHNSQVFAKAVILATGTFLGGLMHTGTTKTEGGRRGDPAAIGMTESLQKAGFETKRLKTGTPPRIDGKSIDYDKIEKQPGHDPAPYFSHFHNGKPSVQNNALCWLTYTTPETAQIIRANIDRAPLFSGQIKGTGPRYCPSVEDKIVRFPEKQRHQQFIEPEGNGTDEIYLNGFATSLPEDVQETAVKTIIGLKNAIITKSGYAIEYDYVPPYQIYPSLETKKVKGLFHAGQINGTSGYEEAAAQGLIAGLNACLYISKEEPFIPRRHEAYIGVLLDDIVTRNISEPYRMFTSRAEYRLALREDNALDRLEKYGQKYDLYEDSEKKIILKRQSDIKKTIGYLKKTRFNSVVLKEKYALHTKKGSLTLADMVCHPEINIEDIIELSGNGLKNHPEIVEQAAILIKYKGYLDKQDREIEKRHRNEETSIPDGFDFKSMKGLKTEALEKLDRFQPQTLGQAGRIEGVTPSDIAVLTLYIKNKRH